MIALMSKSRSAALTECGRLATIGLANQAAVLKPDLGPILRTLSGLTGFHMLVGQAVVARPLTSQQSRIVGPTRTQTAAD